MKYKKNIFKKSLLCKDNSQEKFKLTCKEIYAIKHEKQYYEDSRAVSIEALKIVQKRCGWISDSAIYAIAKILNISASSLEEVATFYSQIFRRPVGRHIIRYCDSVVCYINGYQKNKILLEKYLKIKNGQTTFDNRFTLLSVCCLGSCDKGPIIMINEDILFNSTYHNIINLLEKYP